MAARMLASSDMTQAEADEINALMAQDAATRAAVNSLPRPRVSGDYTQPWEPNVDLRAPASGAPYAQYQTPEGESITATWDPRMGTWRDQDGYAVSGPMTTQMARQQVNALVPAYSGEFPAAEAGPRTQAEASRALASGAGRVAYDWKGNEYAPGLPNYLRAMAVLRGREQRPSPGSEVRHDLAEAAVGQQNRDLEEELAGLRRAQELSEYELRDWGKPKPRWPVSTTTPPIPWNEAMRKAEENYRRYRLTPDTRPEWLYQPDMDWENYRRAADTLAPERQGMSTVPDFAVSAVPPDAQSVTPAERAEFFARRPQEALLRESSSADVYALGRPGEVTRRFPGQTTYSLGPGTWVRRPAEMPSPAYFAGMTYAPKSPPASAYRYPLSEELPPLSPEEAEQMLRLYPPGMGWADYFRPMPPAPPTPPEWRAAR